MAIRTVRYPILAAGALAAALVLAACSSSSSGSSGSPVTPRASTSPVARGGAVNRGPAASGTIAAITGRTMQVQNPQSGQVAVTWTSGTTFSHEVQVGAARIVVGSCVVATATSSSGSSGSFTATRVVLSSATGGSCGGGGFPGGNRPAGAPGGQRPSGFPTDLPSGARRSGFPAANRNAAFAGGKVTARSGDTITVAMTAFGSSGSTTKRSVLLAATTKVYEQANTTAKSLAVGRCVTAQGKTDSSGTVTATRVQISQPTGGSCTTGFGRVRNGG